MHDTTLQQVKCAVKCLGNVREFDFTGGWSPCEKAVLRFIKGVDKKRQVLKQKTSQSVVEYVEQSQLRWYGHVKRMSDGRTV